MHRVVGWMHQISRIHCNAFIINTHAQKHMQRHTCMFVGCINYHEFTVMYSSYAQKHKDIHAQCTPTHMYIYIYTNKPTHLYTRIQLSNLPLYDVHIQQRCDIPSKAYYCLKARSLLNFTDFGVGLHIGESTTRFYTIKLLECG